MSFTFQGKNIQQLYKTGTITVIPNFLNTLRIPYNEFEKNFANGIKINNQDINEQAVSEYIDYTSGDNVYTNNVGYKHISIYGRTTKGPSGSNSGDCKSDTKNRGGANGGSGGPPIDFGIQKIPIGLNNNIKINFPDNNLKQEVSLGNTVILTANQGARGNNANSPGRDGPTGAKYCANSANNGNTGLRGNVICNVGTCNTGLTPVYAGDTISHYSVPTGMYISEKYIRIYLHYHP